MVRLKHLLYLSTMLLTIASCSNMEQQNPSPSNNTLATIAERRSVRRYTDKPLSMETIDTLLRAAMAAPSSKDRRPWHFVVIDNRSQLDTLATRLPYAAMLKHVPQAIAICGDPNISPVWYIDCAAATENLLLAAQSMGLGAVWTGVYPDADRIEAVKEVLSLPDSILTLAIVPVGYSAGIETPKDKYDSSRIHRNNW